ncbi:XdhC family protein [Nocardia transvalensis]|uniref:XdhC family protein n=1 Tax=Nocardia transvalensis TaxID=37333 RepID=UPI0018930AF7|nr:XdhC/CoxI family protein [Nocardia transvalensis]MBF6333828.1 XdhC family protein [Nocardia transvalensis]
MRDIVDDLLRVWHSGRTAGLATLVRTFGPSPLPVGSAMLVESDGGVFGSVSDGCYEAAVHQAAVEAARTGRRELRRFDATTGLDVGADCGTIDVFVEPFSRSHFPEFPDVAADITTYRPVTVFTVVWHADPEVIGQHLVTDRRHNTELVSLPESDVFVSSYTAPPRLIIFGANAFAAALNVQGRLLGYRVTVCDARETFASPASFPGAEVVVDWPHRYLNSQAAAGDIDSSTALVVVSQDPKFEIPLLTMALRLPEFGYLGALGSRAAHARRTEALQAGGFDEATLARLHTPAGLDIGAHTPMETAIAIAAELLASRRATSRPTVAVS